MGWLDDILNRVTPGSTQELVQDPSASKGDPTRLYDTPPASLFETKNVWELFKSYEERTKVNWGDMPDIQHADFKEAQKALSSVMPLAEIGYRNSETFKGNFKGTENPDLEGVPLRKFWAPNEGTLLTSKLIESTGNGVFYSHKDLTAVSPSAENSFGSIAFHEKIHRGIEKLRPELKSRFGIELTQAEEEGLTRWVQHSYGPPNASSTLRNQWKIAGKEIYDKPYKELLSKHNPIELLAKLNTIAEEKLKASEKLGASARKEFDR